MTICICIVGSFEHGIIVSDWRFIIVVVGVVVVVGGGGGVGVVVVVSNWRIIYSNIVNGAITHICMFPTLMLHSAHSM